MKKVRLCVIARSLDMTSKELIERLRELGMTDAKHHSSLVDPSTVDHLLQRKTSYIRLQFQQFLINVVSVFNFVLKKLQLVVHLCKNIFNSSEELMELKSPGGLGSAILVRYDSELSSKIREDIELSQLTNATTWHRGNLRAGIADSLAGISPIVASGLQTGQMFRVIGTPELVNGIKTGEYAIMKSAEGLLGTVVHSKGKNVVGQLRFGKAKLVPSPILIWQVLHTIMATIQIGEINEEINTLKRRLETSLKRQESTIYGELFSAEAILNDILDERRHTGLFTRLMESRLAQVEQSIGSIFQRNHILISDFKRISSEAVKLDGKVGAIISADLLNEEGQQAQSDVKLMVHIASLDLRVEEARMYHAMEYNPKNLQRLLANVRHKVDDYRKIFETMPSFQQLESHMKECVEKMGWWNRNVFARSINKQTKKASSLNLGDVELPILNSIEGDLLFWKDESGVTYVQQLTDTEIVDKPIT
ncbi:MAG: translation initiation factor IF-2 N-terminal domain-containing protein [Hyphomicrobiales bacterium]